VILDLYSPLKIKTAPLFNTVDLKITRELSGEDTLSFSYPLNDETASLVVEESYIRTSSDEFLIKEVNKKGYYAEVFAILNTEDLRGNIVNSFNASTVTILSAINLAIAGTGWSATDKSGVTNKRSLQLKNKSVWNSLQAIEQTWMVELSFDTLNKVISIYSRKGSDTGAYAINKLNLKDLEVQGNSYDFYTRLIPLGKDGLTISSVNGGKNYVENYSYSSKVLTGYWEDNRYTDPQSLKDDAISKLSDMCKPSRSYKASILDLASMDSNYSFLDINIGDIITIVDENKSIKEKQRTIKIEEYPNEPHRTVITLANRLTTLDYITSDLIDTADTVNSITTTDGMIADSKIQTLDYSKLKNVAVTTADIIDGSIVNAKIGDASITGAKIANATITNVQIANATIGAAQITNASIGSAHIVQGSIGNAHIGVAAIGTAQIQDAAISTAKISNGAITNALIGTAAIGTANIQDGSITNVKIGTAAIGSAQIQDASISTVKIQDASITSAKIVDGSISNVDIANATITGAKIASATITGANIAAATIGTGLIQDGSITTAKIGTAAIGAAQIADASITSAKIVSVSAGSISTGTLNTNLVTIQGNNSKLKISGNRLQVFDNQATPVERISLGDVNGDGSVYGFRVRGTDGTTVLMDETGVKNQGITDGAITNSKISANAVDNGKILDNTITGAKLIADSITAREIATKTITANEIVTGTITAASGIIADATIVTAKIADANITGAKIAAATITAANIQDATITGAKIASATISNANIQDATITGAKIANASITNAHINNLDASKITTGTISASRIFGGTLTLGGSTTNSNGAMQMQDGNGKIFGSIDNSGILMQKPLQITNYYSWNTAGYGEIVGTASAKYDSTVLSLHDGLYNPGGENWIKDFSYNLDEGFINMKLIHQGGQTTDWVTHNCTFGADTMTNSTDRANGVTVLQHGQGGLRIRNYTGDINTGANVMIMGAMSVGTTLTANGGKTVWDNSNASYGSNTYGYWIKYPNGIMEIFQKVPVGDKAITTAWGSIFGMGGQQSLPAFPVSFIEVPVVNISINSSNNNSIILIQNSAPTMSNPPSYELGRGTSGTAYSVTVSYQARGRWK
jgi:phage minor structural protein